MLRAVLFLLCVLPFVISSSQVCGKRRVKRVIGGKEAVPHSWPWQVLIEKKGKAADKIGFGQHCGGTLISRQWVVTAAHCLFMSPDPSMYRIKLGAHNRSEKEAAVQTFGIDKMDINRRFLTDKGYGYDIALIKLSRPAVLNFAVGLACLPKQDDRIPVGTTCYLTGWGKTGFTLGKAISLQQTPLPIASYKDCNAGNSWFQPVDDTSMICAGFGGNTTISGCNGDSGGPLICQENSQWVLRGAVSWGDPKCRAGTTYSVFARVSTFVNWINDRMKERPAQAQPNSGSCMDEHHYCSVWKAEGKCHHPYFEERLKLNCAFSCGHCTLANIHARSLNFIIPVQ
ncbi:elastase-1 [Exaiptasia diaphana]|uniref:Uncharacterized protein n=1 Tax=Exaiptasia diaphana TaxID=2652724 RepID=A0A913YBE1_EXADI|nr:elastase-1 [Exaiptasia diaphana]